MPRTDLAKVARADGRYDVEAFHFVGAGLRHAAQRHEREHPGAGRHLSAQQLVEGVADLAAEEYGLLGVLVLAQWGLRNGEDVGAITFRLIEHGIFAKQDSDRPEDFLGWPPFSELVATRVRARLGSG